MSTEIPAPDSAASATETVVVAAPERPQREPRGGSRGPGSRGPRRDTGRRDSREKSAEGEGPSMIEKGGLHQPVRQSRKGRAPFLFRRAGCRG